MRFCCALRYSYGTCKLPPIIPLGDISPVSLSVTISVLSFSSGGKDFQPDSTRALISQALLLYKTYIGNERKKGEANKLLLNAVIRATCTARPRLCENLLNADFFSICPAQIETKLDQWT